MTKVETRTATGRLVLPQGAKAPADAAKLDGGCATRAPGAFGVDHVQVRLHDLRLVDAPLPWERPVASGWGTGGGTGGGRR